MFRIMITTVFLIIKLTIVSIVMSCNVICKYLESIISLSSQSWIKIKKPVSQSVQWPVGRFAHSTSHITGPVSVMGGGYSGSTLSGSTLSDVWLLDTNRWLWNEVIGLHIMFSLHRRTSYVHVLELG